MTNQERLKFLNETLGTEYKSLVSINWIYVSKCEKLSEDFIREFKDCVDWFYISRYQVLSESFMREFKDYIYWNCFGIVQVLSESLIRDFKDKVSWDYISRFQALSEPFIEEFKDEVSWYFISEYQKLSEPFIEKYKNYVNWINVSACQKLSESFIRKFEESVDWISIIRNQILSEDFIREFKDRIYLPYAIKYQKLSDDFIKESNLTFDKDDTWLYKSTEEKKQTVINTGLYECHDDYFIAYKVIRADRYSLYNKQYKYEVGGTYESNCDTTKKECRFGLSAWTREKAKEYGKNNSLIVKVKINYEDVGRIVQNDGKIRCFRQTFLE
jgi:hypothetical protein